jgi:hypothetical protein
VPAHGLAPQNLSSDKRVDVCADSDEDRGSTPLASSLRLERSVKRRLPRRSATKAGVLVATCVAAPRLRLGRPALFVHDPSSDPLSMNGFYYVYILVSEIDDEIHYSGVATDLRSRLAEHNRGKCSHTSKRKPWKIETAVAF